MDVIERSKDDFILKYCFLFLVVAWHCYFTVQNGSAGNLALIAFAMAITILGSRLRHPSKLRSPMQESFRLSVRYTSVFLVITGIKHLASSSSFTEALASLALSFTPAMIIETVIFAIDRVLAMPFVHGMSDET